MINLPLIPYFLFNERKGEKEKTTCVYGYFTLSVPQWSSSPVLHLDYHHPLNYILIIIIHIVSWLSSSVLYLDHVFIYFIFWLQSSLLYLNYHHRYLDCNLLYYILIIIITTLYCDWLSSISTVTQLLSSTALYADYHHPLFDILIIIVYFICPLSSSSVSQL